MQPSDQVAVIMGIVMLFIIVGVAIACAVVIAHLARRNRGNASLGTMSEQWLAEQRMSRD